VAFAADVPRHKFTGSRLFLYYNERLMEGSTDEDAGAQISDGVLSLQKRGICPEEDWPYDPSQFKIAPPTECYDEAKRNRAATVHRIATNLQSMKTCLARGRPFVVGIEVFPALESDKVASTGLLPTPHPNEESIGGHAVLVVGYNDRHLHFIVRNSWGEDWGDAGHFYIPYAYLTNPTLSSDMWCIDAVFSADDQ
jgi:C1A family cysteine protease